MPDLLKLTKPHPKKQQQKATKLTQSTGEKNKQQWANPDFESQIFITDQIDLTKHFCHRNERYPI